MVITVKIDKYMIQDIKTLFACSALEKLMFSQRISLGSGASLNLI